MLVPIASVIVSTRVNRMVASCVDTSRGPDRADCHAWPHVAQSGADPYEPCVGGVAGFALGASGAAAVLAMGCATLEPKYTALLIPIRIWNPCGISGIT